MIYTLGHSNMSLDELVQLVQPRGISTIIDIRSHPTSKWEQFRKENLEKSLPEHGIAYEWWQGLGGWSKRHLDLVEKFKPLGVDVEVYAKGKFPKQRIGVDKKDKNESGKPTWTNQGLYDYSWYMTLPEFLESATKLIDRGLHEEHIAIMCAETLWWKCHRSMVADYLVFKGRPVWHLQPKVTSHSDAIGNRLERYLPNIRAVWANYPPR